MKKQKLITANRHYLSSVIDVLRYTDVHRIAQRGHDETSDAVYPGNFLALMQLLGKYDPIIAHKLTALPRNAKYRLYQQKCAKMKYCSQWLT